jgi:hypothetical protein
LPRGLFYRRTGFINPVRVYLKCGNL